MCIRLHTFLSKFGTFFSWNLRRCALHLPESGKGGGRGVPGSPPPFSRLCLYLLLCHYHKWLLRGCGGELYDTRGVVTSPSYPATYNTTSDCYWTLRVPAGWAFLERNWKVFIFAISTQLWNCLTSFVHVEVDNTRQYGAFLQVWY